MQKIVGLDRTLNLQQCISFRNKIITECVTDLDKRSEMIIFESILTTFEASFVFSGSWGSSF